MQTERHQPSMSVNVAAQQLTKPGFVERSCERLRGTGLAPERLVLEITETALLDDVERASPR